MERTTVQWGLFLPEMEQGNAQGCPAMHRVPFWPEELGEVFARMGAAFYR
jgi:hypothetical protein